MALIKSYLICCAAIITISMGTDRWIELTKPRKSGRNIAIVQGNVQFWGPELRRLSTSGTGSAMEEAGTIHEVLEDEKRLILVPECTLSAEKHAFTFKGRFKSAAAWEYSSTATTRESMSRTDANQQIEMLSENALRDSYYLVWTVECIGGLRGIIPKKYKEISQICKITITAPEYTATKEEILYYEATEEERFPGRKPWDFTCELPKPPLPSPPKTRQIVDALCKAHGARGSDSWMNTYWHEFSAYLEENHASDISHFLRDMIPLIREWNERNSHIIDYEAITPANAKIRMTQIFNTYIDRDMSRADSEPINIRHPIVTDLARWAEKRIPWCNQYGELHIFPTSVQWTRAVTSQVSLSENYHLQQGWYGSDAYKNWLDTSNGEKYKIQKMEQDGELIKKKKKKTATATATATATQSTEPKKKYKVGSTLISKKETSTYAGKPKKVGDLASLMETATKKSKKSKKSKALESYYNNIYNDMGYYDDDEFDEYGEEYYENDVAAAYWRGYANGLLSRLNQ